MFYRTLFLAALAAIPLAGHSITIAEARALAPGSTVTIENVRLISDIDLVNSTSFRDVEVDDATGALTIFGGNAAMDTLLAGVTVGDRFTLTGVTGNFNGKFQIGTPFSAENIQDLNLPIASVRTVATDYQDGSATAEGLESRLVRIGPVSFVDSGNFAGLTNYTLTDGFLNVVSRVSSGLQDLVGDQIPTGPVFAYGIFGQFDSTDPRDGGYQLLLRARMDVRRIATISSISIDQGELFSGDLNSVLASDDDSYSLFSDATSLTASAIIETTVPTGATFLSMVGETSVARNGIAETLQFRNWNTNGWITASGRTSTSTDTEWQGGRLATTNPIVRSDGLVNVRIRWQPINDEDPSQDGWLHTIDAAWVTYEL